MPLLDSFSTIKLKSAYFVRVENLRKDNRIVYFQFDTGASMSLIGLNTICDENIDLQNKLKSLILDEANRSKVDMLSNSPKTVTNQTIDVYPCMMRNVSIMHTAPIDFYFYIFLGTINMPLLGFDYIDGFTYHHSANGNIEVLSISLESVKHTYPDDVIDFDIVMRRFGNCIN